MKCSKTLEKTLAKNYAELMEDNNPQKNKPPNPKQKKKSKSTPRYIITCRNTKI